MKKKLLSLVLCLALVFSLSLPAGAVVTYTPQDQIGILAEMAEVIRSNGLYSSSEDDPILRALYNLFINDPDAFDIIMSYMFASYDMRSMYIPAEYSDQVFGQSSYVGIGVTIALSDGKLTVTDLNEQGSAQAAGVKVGDVLTEISGKSTSGMTLDGATELLRGEEGTYVDIKVLRDGQILSFRLLRAFIGQREFESRYVEDGVYYMKWSSFSSEEGLNQFKAALSDLAQKNCRSLILDLRDNPGGVLDYACAAAELLLPDDVSYIELGSRSGDEIAFERITAPGTGIALNKVIILSNGGSASAAELLQAALCDTGYGVSVGETTYGKGTGQLNIQFTDGSAALLTALKINGVRSGDYDGTGMYPTFPVENYEIANPALSCSLLSDRELSPGNCSDDAQALNEALVALGYLSAMPEKPYMFTEDTSDALGRLLSASGLPYSGKLDKAAIDTVNQALSSAEETVVFDAQYEKALELARAYAQLPQRYTPTEDGGWVNLE